MPSPEEQKVWVALSGTKDKNGLPMVRIGGGYYPQAVARDIAKGILELIGPDAPGDLAARRRSKFARTILRNGDTF